MWVMKELKTEKHYIKVWEISVPLTTKTKEKKQSRKDKRYFE